MKMTKFYSNKPNILTGGHMREAVYKNKFLFTDERNFYLFDDNKIVKIDFKYKNSPIQSFILWRQLHCNL